MSRIESLADLRPGDLLFGPIGGAAGIGVGLGQLVLGEGFSVGPLSVRHVGIVVEAGREARAWDHVGFDKLPHLVQAMPGGAEEVEMTADTHWTDRHAYARLPEDYPGQAADAAAIARLMVAHNVAYSWASYAALAAWKFGLSTPRLEAWIGRRQEGLSIMIAMLNGELLDTGGMLPRGRAGESLGLPVEAICSVLADQSWTLAGKKIMFGVPHQCVTPGALARQLLFRTEGVSWAFPGRAEPKLSS
jgi:hypothetical protein